MTGLARPALLQIEAAMPVDEKVSRLQHFLGEH
jgi:hypothetical protein